MARFGRGQILLYQLLRGCRALLRRPSSTTVFSHPPNPRPFPCQLPPVQDSPLPLSLRITDRQARIPVKLATPPHSQPHHPTSLNHEFVLLCGCSCDHSLVHDTRSEADNGVALLQIAVGGDVVTDFTSGGQDAGHVLAPETPKYALSEEKEQETSAASVATDVDGRSPTEEERKTLRLVADTLPTTA